MNSVTRFAFAPLVLAMVWAATTAEAQENPFVGTWVLNAERTTFPGGRTPPDMTMTYEALDDGLMRFTAEVRLADGTQAPPRGQTFSFDEEDVHVEGSTGSISTRSTEQIDARTLNMTFKNEAGEVVEINAAGGGGGRLDLDADDPLHHAQR